MDTTKQINQKKRNIKKFKIRDFEKLDKFFFSINFLFTSLLTRKIRFSLSINEMGQLWVKRI